MSTTRTYQQLVGNEEMEPVRGYDAEHVNGIQNVDDDDKSVVLKIITQIPVDHEHRDDTDARDIAEDVEVEDE